MHTRAFSIDIEWLWKSTVAYGCRLIMVFQIQAGVAAAIVAAVATEPGSKARGPVPRYLPT